MIVSKNSLDSTSGKVQAYCNLFSVYKTGEPHNGPLDIGLGLATLWHAYNAVLSIGIVRRKGNVPLH